MTRTLVAFAVTVVYVLLLHWMGDAVYQTDRMAREKSRDTDVLLAHVTIYTITLTLGMIPAFLWWFGPQEILRIVGGFWGATYLTHLTTDYVTSRINARRFSNANNTFLTECERGEAWHAFFVSMLFDQFVHAATLVATLAFVFAWCLP